MGEPQVLIWSGEHRAYWRADRSGYTPDVGRAGHYDRSEAEKILAGVGPEKQLRIDETAPSPPPSLLSAGDLEELERLWRAVNEPSSMITVGSEAHHGLYDELEKAAVKALPRFLAAYRAQEAQLADLRAQVERQAAALKPFNTVAGSISVGCHDNTPVAYVDDTLGITCRPKKTELTAGEFRAIRAALPLPPDLGERK